MWCVDVSLLSFIIFPLCLCVEVWGQLCLQVVVQWGSGKVCRRHAAVCFHLQVRHKAVPASLIFNEKVNEEPNLHSGCSTTLVPLLLVNPPHDLCFVFNLSSCPCRIQTVNVTGHYQYQKKDSFVREPFIVQFQSNKTGQCAQNKILFSNSLSCLKQADTRRTFQKCCVSLPCLRSCSNQWVCSGSSPHGAHESCPGDGPTLRRLWGCREEMEQHGEDHVGP